MPSKRSRVLSETVAVVKAEWNCPRTAIGDRSDSMLELMEVSSPCMPPPPTGLLRMKYTPRRFFKRTGSRVQKKMDWETSQAYVGGTASRLPLVITPKWIDSQRKKTREGEVKFGNPGNPICQCLKPGNDSPLWDIVMVMTGLTKKGDIAYDHESEVEPMDISITEEELEQSIIICSQESENDDKKKVTNESKYGRSEKGNKITQKAIIKLCFKRTKIDSNKARKAAQKIFNFAKNSHNPKSICSMAQMRVRD